MYLSRLTLNPRDWTVRRDLANRYELHRSLQRFLAGTEGRALWRLEPASEACPVVLVQSWSEPNWAKFLPVSYCVDTACKPWDIDRYVVEGGVYRFRLLANPTQARSPGPGIRGKRTALLDLDSQYLWLQRQAQVGGFELKGYMVADERFESFFKKDQRISMHTVLYEGHLCVRQQGTFIDCLKSGLGRGKGFGFGLLSIARSGL